MKRLIIALALTTASCLAFSAPAVAAEKNYDCSKPGNASKAVCKGAAKSTAKAAPAKVATTTKPGAGSSKTATARSYDCSKPGNKSKAVCKSPATAAAARAAASKPASAPAMKSASKTATASADDRNPKGASAACKDGTYSHAKVHSGACSRHGGVAKWL